MDTKPYDSQAAWTCRQSRNQSRFPSHPQHRDAQSVPSRSREGRNSPFAGAGYAQEIRGLPVMGRAGQGE